MIRGRGRAVELCGSLVVSVLLLNRCCSGKGEVWCFENVLLFVYSTCSCVINTTYTCCFFSRGGHEGLQVIFWRGRWSPLMMSTLGTTRAGGNHEKLYDIV